MLKRLKFNHAIKGYMHIQESVLENNILCEFKNQMDHVILARRLDQVLLKRKKNHHLEDFVVSADLRFKVKESEKYTNTVILPENGKKLRSMRVIIILIVVSALGIVSNNVEEDLKIGDQRKNSGPPDQSSCKIS